MSFVIRLPGRPPLLLAGALLLFCLASFLGCGKKAPEGKGEPGKELPALLKKAKPEDVRAELHLRTALAALTLTADEIKPCPRLPSPTNPFLKLDPEKLKDAKFKADTLADLRDKQRKSPLKEVSTADLLKRMRQEAYAVFGGFDVYDLLDIGPGVAAADIPKIKGNARGVAYVCPQTAITPAPGMPGFSQITTVRYGSTVTFCEKGDFDDEPSVAELWGGTAFLVGPKHFLTAHHVAGTVSFDKVAFFFGYEKTGPTSPAPGTFLIDNNELYTGKTLVDYALPPKDWSLIEVDREVMGRPVLPIRTAGKIPDGDKIYMLGYPRGLPLKYSGDAVVKDNAPADTFTANLDAEPRNSGSPVFSATSHVIEGILTGRTVIDRYWDDTNKCCVVMVYPADSGEGYTVTRASAFKAAILALTPP